MGRGREGERASESDRSKARQVGGVGGSVCSCGREGERASESDRSKSRQVGGVDVGGSVCLCERVE